MKNKKGKIYFSQEFLKDIISNSEIAKEIFSKFYPIIIRECIDYNNDGRWYLGVSEEFMEIPEGQIIPEYECQVTINDLEEEFNDEFRKEFGIENEKEIIVTFKLKETNEEVQRNLCV